MNRQNPLKFSIKVDPIVFLMKEGKRPSWYNDYASIAFCIAFVKRWNVPNVPRIIKVWMDFLWYILTAKQGWITWNDIRLTKNHDSFLRFMRNELKRASAPQQPKLFSSSKMISNGLFYILILILQDFYTKFFLSIV